MAERSAADTPWTDQAAGDSAVLYARAVGQWETDRASAIRWLVKAAEQGCPQAQLRLGMLYESGEDVAQNHRLAAMWYMRAAAKELGEAQYRLALCYARGKGVQWDRNAADYWFSKSEENGFFP